MNGLKQNWIQIAGKFIFFKTFIFDIYLSTYLALFEMVWLAQKFKNLQ